MKKLSQQIPEKDQLHVKVGRKDIIRDNGEIRFDEQWMKKTSKDSTLHFFCFFQRTFFQNLSC